MQEGCRTSTFVGNLPEGINLRQIELDRRSHDPPHLGTFETPAGFKKNSRLFFTNYCKGGFMPLIIKHGVEVSVTSICYHMEVSTAIHR